MRTLLLVLFISAATRAQLTVSGHIEDAVCSTTSQCKIEFAPVDNGSPAAYTDALYST